MMVTAPTYRGVVGLKRDNPQKRLSGNLRVCDGDEEEGERGKERGREMRRTMAIISKLPPPYLWMLLQAIVRTLPFGLLSDTL